MKRLLPLIVLLFALPLMGASAPPAVSYDLAPVMTDGRLTAIAVTLRFRGGAGALSPAPYDRYTRTIPRLPQCP